MKTSNAVHLFIQSRQAKSLSPMTVKWYQGIMEKFSGKYLDLPRDPENIDEFLQSLDVGDERRHGYFRALKALYRFLVKRKYINYNPLGVIDQPKIKTKDPPTLTPEEIAIILNYPGIKPCVRAAILLFIDTGCRLEEVHTLRPENLLEYPDGFAAIVNGKNGSRIIPISYQAYHALMVNLPFPYNPGVSNLPVNCWGSMLGQ